METTRFCLFFLLTCLLGIISRQVSASESTPKHLPQESATDAAAHVGAEKEKTSSTPEVRADEAVQKATEEGSQKSDNDATEEKHEAKALKEEAFPLGHRIEVQVHHGSYVVERDEASPDVLTISLQLLDGEKHVLGFVPMAEVTAMLEEAKTLGNGLPQGLLDTNFLSYAFDREETAVELDRPDMLATTKLAQQIIKAEAEADAQQEGTAGKKRDDDDDDDDDDEDGEDEEDDDEEGEDVDEDEDEDEEELRDKPAKEASLRGSKN